MRVAITGELGFIARNLPRALNFWGCEFVSILKQGGGPNSEYDVCNPVEWWTDVLKGEEIDVLIHNAAIVGSDVVNMKPLKATHVNIVGTQLLVEACNRAKTKMCYLGTTVAYDTSHCRSNSRSAQLITEKTPQMPQTLYGIQKLAAEHIVRALSNDWLILRPLFCYGGVGDLCSMISKVVYAHFTEQKAHIYLDPKMYKDWMYVDDFCDAVAVAISMNLCNDDYNVASHEPVLPTDVIDFLPVKPDTVIWHPELDYLGNHLLDSKKFRNETGWAPKWSLPEGCTLAVNNIMANLGSYDPLQFVREQQSG